jgi:hypothetical protein
MDTTATAHVCWRDNARTILYQNFNYNWTIDDYRATLQRTYRLIDKAKGPVDIIADFSQNTASVSRLLAASQHTAVALGEQFPVHRRQRLMVVVGGGRFLRTLLDLGERHAPGAVVGLQYADSVDEARVLIHRRRVIRA